MKPVEFEIVSVNVSAAKGTSKNPVGDAEICAHGIGGDAHAGRGARQVSLLSIESIERFGDEEGRSILPGEFAENLTIKGLSADGIKPLDKFVIGGAQLEVTQIGKACHGGTCAIFREIGRCVMPAEGLFTRVIHPGIVRQGDRGHYERKTYTVRIITVSDRAFSGEYDDKTGPATEKILVDFFAERGWNSQIDRTVVPDELEKIDGEIMRALSGGADVIFAAGGTGIGPRDVTPEALSAWIEKPMPGVVEAIRAKFAESNPRALLSRAVAGAAGDCLIYAVPGSVRGATEYTSEILKTLEHAMYMVRGIDVH